MKSEKKKQKGRSKKWIFEKGDRIINIKNGPTRWRFIKDIEPGAKTRKSILVCDCGSIEVRNLMEAVHGKSMGCKKCKENRNGSHKIKNSMQSASVALGKSKGYFSTMKIRYPKRFEKIKKLGKGDLVEGWYMEQEIKQNEKKLI